jgi:hypothetical protein
VNWVFSDKTPAILVLLFALLSWQAGEIFDEVRSGNAVIYTLFEDPPAEKAAFPDSIALKVENPSRIAVAGPFSFTLGCRQRQAGCLTGRAAPFVEDPNFSDARTEPASTPDRAKLTATLPPGAVVWLVAETVRPNGMAAKPDNGEAKAFDEDLTRFRAVFRMEPVEGAEEPAPLRTIEGGSIEAKIVRNWLSLLYYGMVVIVIALFLWVVAAIARLLARGKAGGASGTLAISGAVTSSDAVAHGKLDAVAHKLAELERKIDKAGTKPNKE